MVRIVKFVNIHVHHPLLKKAENPTQHSDNISHLIVADIPTYQQKDGQTEFEDRAKIVIYIY